MSTTLKDILGAILSDSLRAQHDANVFLQSLSEQYATGGRLSGMHLPAASLGELEFKLNYAVTEGVEEKEEEGVNGKEIDRTLRYVARETAELLIKTMVHTIQCSPADYKAQYGFVDTLQDNRDFRRHLAKRFAAILTSDRDRLMGPDASLSLKAVYNLLYPAAVEHLIDHEDIRGLFLQDPTLDLRSAVAAEFQRVLTKELDDILRESTMPSFRRIQRYGSLQVEVANQALANLPPEAIQTMTIRIVPSQQELKIQNSTDENK